MAVDTSMYAAPPQSNSLVDMLRLFSVLGNQSTPNQLSGPLGLPGLSGGVAGAGGGSPMKATDVGKHAATIVDELRANGMSDNGIRGVLANVQDESGFDPTLRHKDQPHWSGEAAYAHGLYQEGAGEWNNYAGWLQKNAPGSDWRDPRLQTRFLAQNLQQNYPSTWKALNTGTPESAAQALVSGYLKPRADFESSRRAKYAKGVPEIDAFTGGQKTAMAAPQTATDAAPAALPASVGVSVTADQAQPQQADADYWKKWGVSVEGPVQSTPASAVSDSDYFKKWGVTTAEPASAAPATAQPSTPARELPTIDPFPLIPTTQKELGSVGQTATGLYKGAIEDPILGTSQLLAHGAAYAADLGGSAPNAASRFLGQSRDALDRMVATREAAYQAQRRAVEGEDLPDVARGIGAVASPANFLTAGALAPSAGANVLTRFMRAPITGAAIGAEQPVTNGDYAAEKTKQAETGAIGGLIGEGVATGIQPWVGSDAAKTLLDRGVPLTPGQMTGGMLKGVEDKAASIPFVGDLIKARQRDALLGFNRSNLDDMLSDIGQKLPKDVSPGTESLDTALKLWKNDRESLLARSQGKLDQPLTQDIAAVRAGKDPVSEEDTFLPQAQQDRVNSLADRIESLAAKYPQGIPAKEVTGMSSALDNEARGLASNPDHYQRQLGGAVDNLAKAWDRMVARQNPDIAPKLADSDRAYAKWVRIRDAAGSSTATEGIYTPHGFATSVSRNALTKNQKATGNALMQDAAQAGKSTLPSSVPNSGTADRAALMETLLALGGGVGGHALGAPLGVMAAGPAAAALYSRPGQAAARWLASAGYEPRNALGQAVRNYGVPVGASAANTLTPYLQPGSPR